MPTTAQPCNCKHGVHNFTPGQCISKADGRTMRLKAQPTNGVWAAFAERPETGGAAGLAGGINPWMGFNDGLLKVMTSMSDPQDPPRKVS